MMFKIPTELARDLMDAESREKYDIHAKKILSYRPILAYILKDCVKAYKNYSVEEIQNRFLTDEIEVNYEKHPLDGNLSVDKLNQEFVGAEFRLTIFDIRFRAKLPDGGEIGLQINVEAQWYNYLPYEPVSRGQYHGALMLGSKKPDLRVPDGTPEEEAEKIKQKKLADFYNGLGHVYSIWICFDPKAAARDAITSYDTHPTRLYGDYVVDEKYYDKISVVMVYLNPKNKNGLEKRPMSLELLNLLFTEM